MFNHEPPEPPRHLKAEEKEKAFEELTKKYKKVFIFLRLLAVLDKYQVHYQREEHRDLFSAEDDLKNVQEMRWVLFGTDTSGKFDRNVRAIIDEYELSQIDDENFFQEFYVFAQDWFSRKQSRLAPQEVENTKSSTVLIKGLIYFMRENLFSEGKDVQSFLRVLKSAGKPYSTNPVYAFKTLKYEDTGLLQSDNPERESEVLYLILLQDLLRDQFFPPEEKPRLLGVRDDVVESDGNEEFQEEKHFYSKVETELQIVLYFLDKSRYSPESLDSGQLAKTVTSVWQKEQVFIDLTKNLNNLVGSTDQPSNHILYRVIDLVRSWKNVTDSITREEQDFSLDDMVSVVKKIILYIHDGLFPHSKSAVDTSNFFRALERYGTKNPATLLASETSEKEHPDMSEKQMQALKVVEQFLDKQYFHSSK